MRHGNRENSLFRIFSLKWKFSPNKTILCSVIYYFFCQNFIFSLIERETIETTKKHTHLRSTSPSKKKETQIIYTLWILIILAFTINKIDYLVCPIFSHIFPIFVTFTRNFWTNMMGRELKLYPASEVTVEIVYNETGYNEQPDITSKFGAEVWSRI